MLIFPTEGPDLDRPKMNDRTQIRRFGASRPGNRTGPHEPANPEGYAILRSIRLPAPGRDNVIHSSVRDELSQVFVGVVHREHRDPQFWQIRPKHVDFG